MAAYQEKAYNQDWTVGTSDSWLLITMFEALIDQAGLLTGVS